MKDEYGTLSQWFLFILGLVITLLWVVFCFNSEIDRTGGLVLSKFFVGKAISVWIFLGAGIILFSIAISLFVGLIRFLEDKRTFAYRDKTKSKKLNTIVVILGLLFFIALIAMIVGALIVLTSSGSNSNTPGTLYYYY